MSKLAVHHYGTDGHVQKVKNDMILILLFCNYCV
jgi:hypothetical protein